MTVNERLYHLGLMDKFYAAIRERKEADAILLLQKLELSKEQATETVVTIFENPSKYGYS